MKFLITYFINKCLFINEIVIRNIIKHKKHVSNKMFTLSKEKLEKFNLKKKNKKKKNY